tara:strand:- start:860 stop:1090 length:231 start_codon:yes stop_codon:yes gene_type:complete
MESHSLSAYLRLGGMASRKKALIEMNASAEAHRCLPNKDKQEEENGDEWKNIHCWSVGLIGLWQLGHQIESEGCHP